MATLYDTATVTYDSGLVTYDGDNAVGVMTGTVSIKTAMTGTIT